MGFWRDLIGKGKGRQGDDIYGEGNVSAQDDGGDAPTQEGVATPAPAEPEQQDNKFGNLDDLYQYLVKQVGEDSVQSAMDKRRERSRGIVAGISDMGMALANLFYTTKGAPNMYDGKNSLSAKARERMDKAKADREKNREQFMRYYQAMKQQQNGDRDFDFRQQQAERQQTNWQAQFDANRSDRDVDVQFRQQQAERQQDNADRAFNESVRQHNETIGMQRARMAREQANDSQTYTLGEGYGSVVVPKAAINSHNISAIYKALPLDYQTAKGAPIYESGVGGVKYVSGNAEPTPEEMVVCIGAFLGNPDVKDEDKMSTRNALLQIGKPSGKKQNPMN